MPKTISGIELSLDRLSRSLSIVNTVNGIELSFDDLWRAVSLLLGLSSSLML
jgi:hypothetical protein